MEIFSNFKAIVLVIFFFGASIFVHELGHFLTARWRGLKVTRFSIGFGPKLFSWTRGGVEYIVAALPIGGYVALPQLGHMEIIEGEAEPSEAKEVSWTSKVIVLTAGAICNVIFALFLGSVLYFMGGRPVSMYNNITELGAIPETLAISEDTIVPSPAFQAGLKKGDIVRAIDGKSVSKWETIEKRIIMGSKRTSDDKPLSLFSIERNGKLLEFKVLPIIAGQEQIRTVGISPKFPDIPAIVGFVKEGFPAEDAGLLAGDQLMLMDGQTIHSTEQVAQYIKQSPGKEITFIISRGKEKLTKIIEPKIAIINEAGDKSPLIGVEWYMGKKYLKEPPLVLFKSVVVETFETLEKLVNPKSDLGIRHLSGPVGMGRIIYQSAKWDIRMVFWVVVIININLAILNLLPIPVLDGGHIVFATIEKIRGRALPQNLMMSMQGAFMIVLLSLMLYVTFFDGKRILLENSQDKAAEVDQFQPTLESTNPSEDSKIEP
ncbi:MAG: RIP metalloprotease RseP [Verrucomicrobia bacterium]|nr:RIP metalloprotease RseP [Verrucomicrobiota bacterium]MDA1067932.1 RIP metalloprotease RseP [Verrucomicrobiota bacterium]